MMVAVAVLVNEVKSKIDELIKNKELDYFAATRNLWISAVGDSYITFTAHYIDSSWKLTSNCRQTHYLSQNHTEANTAQVLEGHLTWKFNLH